MKGRAENARQYVEGLARSGRYFFNSGDALFREAGVIEPLVLPHAVTWRR